MYKKFCIAFYLRLRRFLKFLGIKFAIFGPSQVPGKQIPNTRNKRKDACHLMYKINIWCRKTGTSVKYLLKNTEPEMIAMNGEENFASQFKLKKYSLSYKEAK